MMALRGPELARLLEFMELSPAPESPLANRPLDPGDASPELAAALPGEVREAAVRVARPERVVAMATGMPPEPPEHLWFYGQAGDLDFALYAEGPEDRHHLAWPVDGVSMLDLAAAPLALSRGTEPTALSLALGPEEFCTLCAISDFLRQETLRTLLAPVPRPEAGIAHVPAGREGNATDTAWDARDRGRAAPLLHRLSCVVD